MSNPNEPRGEYRRRQKSRNRVLALLLGAMVLLFYLIAMVRISAGS